MGDVRVARDGDDFLFDDFDGQTKRVPLRLVLACAAEQRETIEAAVAAFEVLRLFVGGEAEAGGVDEFHAKGLAVLLDAMTDRMMVHVNLGDYRKDVAVVLENFDISL